MWIQSSHRVHGRATPSSVSPGSSFGGSSAGSMDESQNTIVTEPDDVVGFRAFPYVSAISVHLNSAPMTRDEVRDVRHFLALTNRRVLT